MIGTELIFKASIRHSKPSKLLWQVKLVNFARFIVRINNVKMSASLFNLDVEEIGYEQTGIGCICIMDGTAVREVLREGGGFEICVCDEVLATGKILEFLD